MKKVGVIFISLLVITLLTAQVLPQQINTGACDIQVYIPVTEADTNVTYLEPVTISVNCVDEHKIKVLDEWAREGWTVVDSLDEYIQENCNG